MNESQNRFPGKNLALRAGVFREARFSSLKSSWEARKNLACVLRLLVFRVSDVLAFLCVYIFGFFGLRQFFIFTVSKRTRMFVLWMKSRVFFIQSIKWVNS